MNRWQTRAAAAFVVWAALFGAPPTVDAGAWTQPKGGGYLKTWIRFQAAIGFLDGYHDDNGDFRYTGNYSETGIHFYGEYGVTDWLTVIGAWAPFQVYRLGQLGGTTVTRPTDPLLGARFALLRKDFRLSFEMDTRFPTVTNRAFAPFFEIDQETHEVGEQLGYLRVGSGVFDVEPRLQFGWGTERGHFGTEFGWRFRTGGFQDAMVWLMEGGYRFHPKVYATVRIVQLLARGPVEPLPNTGSPSGVTNGTSYFAFSFEVDYLLNDRALSVGIVAEGATFYERQAGGPVFSLYLAKKWDGSKSRQ